MKKVLLISLFLTFVACKLQSKGVVNISVQDLNNQISEKIQLVDVRTPAECNKGIIKGALEINVTSEDFEEKVLEKLDKSKPVYVYCKSGGRSLIASEMLLKQGFKVYNVEGGYNEWKNKIKK